MDPGNKDNLTTTISPISFGDNPSSLSFNDVNCYNEQGGFNKFNPKEDLNDVTKYKKLLAKYKKKSKISKDEITSLQKQVSYFRIENDRIKTHINSLKEDNHMLQLQLEAGHASHVESETAWTSIKSQNNQLLMANDSLQKQIESQRNEISKYAKERQSIVVLVRNLHDALCQSEVNYSKLLDENQELKKSCKKSNKLFESDNLDFNALTFPYKDLNFASKLITLSRSTQYSGLQKVQTIINETAKEIDGKNSELTEITNELNEIKSEFSKKEENLKKTNDMYSIIFNELKQVELSAHNFEGRLFCDMDHAFRDFMAKHTLDFDFVKRNSNIAYELFSEEIRSQLLSQFNGLSEQLIIAFFIINAELKKQLANANKSLMKADSLRNSLDIFSCKSPEDLPKKIDAVVHKLGKLQTLKKQLVKALDDTKGKLKNAEKENEKLNEQLNSTKSSNNKLKNKIRNLSAELQTTKNDFSNPQNHNPNQFHQNSPINSEDEAKKEAILLLKTQLLQKDGQIQRLTTTLETLKAENSRNAELANGFRQKLELLQHSYQQIKMQQMNDHEKAKKKLKSFQKDREIELNEMNDRIEELTRTLSSNSLENHRKIEQLNALAKKLSISLAESERRGRDLCTDNSRLKIAVQTLQMKIISDQDRMKQERQATEAKAVAQILAVETKMHESHSTEKAKIVGQKQSLIEFVADELGTIYGIDSNDLDDETFKELILRVKIDLRKLNLCSL
ncbi:hypothetical protein TRFO_38516 [Tritrichomonas foetus]|uniref:Uncharacterized protein n=1 Tax=Tritrichomonas foetus TaxID=1144522 RepID=A0A1J4J826_9EUKA|nr:hypothetical protein TRFO_38516 [Tritrichomonas foetus]|eukprot:OHS95354.1 hypothetical protein TRFO_38516 [Tritrichomonas foetus]